jgi:hypothetical protein
MRAQKLLPATTESAPLADLGTLQSALAWDLLHSIRSRFPRAQGKVRCGAAPAAPGRLENYIRGMLATTADEKVQQYREAARSIPITRKPGWNWVRPTIRSAPTNRRSPPCQVSSAAYFRQSPARPISISV